MPFDSERLRMYNRALAPAHARSVCIWLEVQKMRLPLLSYFMVVGSLLAGLLFWGSNEIGLNSSPLKTSQVVGLPRPFKATRRESIPDLTAVNIAAEYERSQTKILETVAFAVEHMRPKKPVETVETRRRETTTSEYAPTWNRSVEYRHDNLSIH